jgi:hypothetical protein
MSDLVRIEYQDNSGRWHIVVRTINGPTIIRARFNEVLRNQKNATKVRAVDDKTGQLIDMQQR